MGRQRLNPGLQYGRRHDHRQEAEDIPPVGDDPAFVMLVKTDNAGTSASNQMTLPLEGSYTVDWGDGVVQNLSEAQTHTYPAIGEYTIRITGGLTRILFAGGGDRRKLLDIQNWGDIAWASMRSAFWECTNMIVTATDTPNLSSATSIRSMFYGTSKFNSNLSEWDVSTIIDMELTFALASIFNGDISTWDVGNVAIANNMFQNASAFNQDISGWNINKVTNLSNMFLSASSFNRNIGGWDVSNVTAMTQMFLGVTLSPANYGALLIGWAAQTLKTGVNFHGGNSKYPTDGTGNPATDAAAARAKIIADFGWTIVDGGPE